jgi:hypothetical protein
MIIRISIPEPIKTLISQSSDRVSQEIAGNERLRWLLCLSGLTLYCALVIYLSGLSDSAQRSLQLSQSQLARVTLQTEDTQWPERAAEARKLVVGLETRLWPGDTPGLAEAGFERWIRRTFEEYGAQVRQVQLTRGPALEDRGDFTATNLSSIQRIRAKVVSPLNEPALVNFLNDSANQKAWVIVEQLIVRPGRNARLEIDLATLYKITEQNQ